MNEGRSVRWKLYAEAFRVWLPVVLSLCAISLTVFQAMSTRRHARLSVQPRIEWRVGADAVSCTLDITLANVGFGPGVLSGIAIVVDGEAIPAVDLAACRQVTERIGRAVEADWDTHCFANRRDYVRRAGDTVSIFASRPAAARAGEDHSAALVDFSRLAVTATYCSFYQDCWPLEAE